MTGGQPGPRLVLIHADESCLGNQRLGPQPGGAGALVEIRSADVIDRFDWFAGSPATTNNRMALHGAIAVLERVLKTRDSIAIHYYSDSRYLVDGISNWIHGWKKRGWKRKGGPIENLEMWQRLDRIVTGQPVTFHWVKGHAGHSKNEYADYLAVQAAQAQAASDHLQPSAFTEWLSNQKFAHPTNPDTHYSRAEATLLG